MWSMIFRQVKLFVFILAGYLVQVCVMHRLGSDGVTASMLFASVAVVTVGYGRIRALWTGAIYGILLETFLASVSMLNLIFYPVSALLFSVFFADKSAARLQYERSVGKAGRNRSPLLRTVLCAAFNTIAFEVVNLVYAYLKSDALGDSAILRAVSCVVQTTLLTAVIMIPARWLLGFRKQEPEGQSELRFGKPLKLDD